MALRIGRVQVTRIADPVPIVQREYETRGVVRRPRFMGAQPTAWSLRGLESGASAAQKMLDLARELQRPDSVYVKDDNSDLAEGYYELLRGQPGRVVPLGDATKGYDWRLELQEQPDPVIWRQGEADLNAASGTGSTLTDRTAMEALVAKWVSPGTSEVVVLNPRTLSSPEPFNLPEGTWKCVARVMSVTVFTQLYRWRLVDLTGATIASGLQVSVSEAGKFLDLDLGNIAVPAANHAANWPVLLVQTAAGSQEVRVDWWRFHRVA